MHAELLSKFKKKRKKSHLPNSKIMAQISRALSTSLRFDPLRFSMTDTIKVACGLLVHAVQQGARSAKGGKATKKRRWTELGTLAVSCLPDSHKFLLLRVALVPQIPPYWLNRGFQACPSQ